MSCHEAAVQHINLKPGKVFIASTPHIVSTLLGSCVAITLFTPIHRVGAICHALLPTCRDGKNYDCPEMFRHVSCSLRGMLAMFRERGIACALIEAKIFGGADMFPNESERKGESYRATVGGLNIAKAKEMLDAEGIPIIAADVGGWQGRKILFRPHTGEVFLQRMNRMVDLEAGGESVL
jgi:chemotaxis protein CheD